MFAGNHREANQIKQWRDQLLEGATGVFGAAVNRDAEPATDVKTLHAKIGELALENVPPQGLRGRIAATIPAARSGMFDKADLFPSAKR